MSVVTPYKAIEQISQATDQRQAIVDAVGDLSDIEIIGDLVLLGIYISKEKTKGGIILPTATKAEDVWQGKVGLVLKWGPDAFVDSDTGSPFEQNIGVGEWGVFKVGDAWSLNIRGVPCKLVRDTSLRMKVKDPSIIF